MYINQIKNIYISFRYDLDQPSFATPTTDDSFFLVRYLKQETANGKHSDNLITKNKSSEENSSEKTVKNLNIMSPPSLIVTEAPEYKGHTLACQRFITNACTGK